MKRRPLGLATIFCLCGVAGCVSQIEYDAIARANLQLQDKLAASQADRVKGRTQITMLRQELVTARQDRQDALDRLQAQIVETDTLRARLDLQTQRLARPQTRPAPGAQAPLAGENQP